MKDILDFTKTEEEKAKVKFLDPRAAYSNRKSVRHATWIPQRRAIMAQIIASDQTRKWSPRELAEAMRAHPLVAEYHVNYGETTAWRDFVALRSELSERRVELAEQYISYQLEIADAIIDDLWQEYNELNKIDPRDLVPEMRAQYLMDKIEKKDQITRGIERMFKRQANLIPDLDAPKKVNVQTTSISMSLDKFLEFKKQALIAEQNIIDGEVVESTESEE